MRRFRESELLSIPLNMTAWYAKARSSGTEYAHSTAQKMAIENMNIILLIAALVPWSYVPIDLLAEDMNLFWMNLLTGFGYLSCYFLVRKGFVLPGKMLGFLLANVTIFLTGDAVGPEARVHYFQLIAGVLPFLAFAREDLRFMLLSSAGGVLGWLLGYLVPAHSVMPACPHPEYYTPWLAIVITPFFIMAIILQTYNLFHQQLALTEKQAKELINSNRMAAIGSMSAGIAHEVNSPLAIITVHTAAVRMELQNPEFDRARAEKRLETVERTVTRISKITGALLAFARFDRGSGVGRREARVRETIEAARELVSEKFSVDGVELRVRECEPVTLSIDETHLSQILLNLLINASDAVAPLPERWVEVSGHREGDSYHLIVRDSGKGIPSSVAEKMMEPFFTTKELGKGTGLGLSISKGFAEACGGGLAYSLQEGHTAFVARFPLAG